MVEKMKHKKQPAQTSKVVSEKEIAAWLYLTPVLILTFILYSTTLKNYFIINVSYIME